MNALVRKEIRLILPAWAAAMFLATVPWWLLVLLPSPPPWTDNTEAGTPLLTLFFFGALYLAITSFGQEFSLNTFPLLLAQPVSRRRLWTTKVLVLAVAFVTLLLGLWVSWRMSVVGKPVGTALRDLMIVSGCGVLVLVAGGLWTTLLTRQVAVAFWLTLLFPMALAGLVALVLYAIHEPDWPPALTVVMAVVYSAASFLWARRLFRRAEDVPWSGGSISIPTWRSRTRVQSLTPAPKGNSLAALIRKELHFHQLSLMIAGLLVLLHVPVIALRLAHPDHSGSNNLLTALLVCWFMLWLMLPFLIGGMAVAEERRLGTLESFLCLPTTRRAQFGVKLGVVLVLSVLTCAVIPWTLETVGIHFGVQQSLLKQGSGLTDLAAFSLFAAGLAFVSFYASTIARNTLQAIGTAFILNFPVIGLGVWYTSNIYGGSNFFSHGQSPLGAYIGYPVMLLVFGWLAFRNFRHLQVGWSLWTRNGLTLLVSLGAVFLATQLVSDRVWERFMTLEPPPGPARLSGPVRPKIEFILGNVFVLLPDGRLWAGTHYERKELNEYWRDGDPENNTRHRAFIMVPVGGTFIGTSNWVSLASSGMAGREVCGIQSDGSLWKISFPNRTLSFTTRLVVPKLERVGEDSNWKTLVAGYNNFLALKSDGTLWGWGANENGQLGPGPRGLVDRPTRINPDSDWTAIFTAGTTFIGVKRDGSVWKWGLVLFEPNKTQPQVRTYGPAPKPARWDVNGTGWIAFSGVPDRNFVVRDDGSLWASADFVFENVFSQQLGPGVTSQLLRVGNDSDWVDIVGKYNFQVGLKRDGTFLQSHVSVPLNWRKTVLKPSKHSDWVAIGTFWSRAATLAADGTLCYWPDPNAASDVLGPSRGPAWAGNIFSLTKETETAR